jgi:transcriptional regulator with XRE-family HTH domain
VDVKSVFGKNLKRLREQRGLTLTELAKRVGKKHSQQSLVESGKIGFTSETVTLYASELKCHPSELFHVEHDEEAAKELKALRERVATLEDQAAIGGILKRKFASEPGVLGLLCELDQTGVSVLAKHIRSLHGLAKE